jgi:hypothetical protein
LSVVLLAAILFGSVTIGPLTPVCRVGTPCSGPAKSASLVFTHRSRRVVAHTDALGHYRVTLAPGTWQVRASVGMRTTPSSVLVVSGTHRENFAVDTGIR